MKRLNVLVSSTSMWNPGDDFIRQGCLNVLKSNSDYEFNFIMFNRNPDLQINNKGPGIFPMREDTVGNYLIWQDLEEIDFVLLAGTPSWYDRPYDKLYEKVFALNIPILAMGVGMTPSVLMLTREEYQIFARDNTFITTRATEITNFLNSILDTNKVRSLPCPAILSSSHFFGEHNKGIAQIAQGGWAFDTGVNEKYLVGIQKKYPVICMHIHEWKEYTSHGFDTVYDFDYQILQEKFSEYTTIYSTRLHGAIGALSTGTPAVLIGNDNFRLSTAAKIYGECLPIVENFEKAQTAKLATLSLIEETKNLAFQSHKKTVDEFLNFNF